MVTPARSGWKKLLCDGDRVFGFGQGTYAEYAAAPVSTIAPIPKSIDFVTAAALPTAGLTALQIIRDVAQFTGGMRILIHGAAGGVGSFATQIAKSTGAYVIGTATDDDIAYLKSLGIDEVIDYKRERFEQKVGSVDAVQGTSSFCTQCTQEQTNLGAPPKHNVYLRETFFFRTERVLLCRCFSRSRLRCKFFICSFISCFRLLAAKNTSSGSLS